MDLTFPEFEAEFACELFSSADAGQPGRRPVLSISTRGRSETRERFPARTAHPKR